MRNEIPIETIYGEPTAFFLLIEPGGDYLRLHIDEGFAGREVDEELPLDALIDLLAGGPRRNNDLLGFTLETDGGETVTGTIGVGSGNQRFALRREKLEVALKSFG